MRFVVSYDAESDLIKIWGYIAKDSTRAASRNLGAYGTRFARLLMRR